MISRTLTLPELGLIAGTRAALGAGIGLLLADHLAASERKAVGWTLLAVGALTTIPLAAEVIFKHDPQSEDSERSQGRLEPNDITAEI